jgi:hypothetical protein
MLPTMSSSSLEVRYLEAVNAALLAREDEAREAYERAANHLLQMIMDLEAAKLQAIKGVRPARV